MSGNVRISKKTIGDGVTQYLPLASSLVRQLTYFPQYVPFPRSKILQMEDGTIIKGELYTPEIGAATVIAGYRYLVYGDEHIGGGLSFYPTDDPLGFRNTYVSRGIHEPFTALDMPDFSILKIPSGAAGIGAYRIEMQYVNYAWVRNGEGATVPYIRLPSGQTMYQITGDGKFAEMVGTSVYYEATAFNGLVSFAELQNNNPTGKTKLSNGKWRLFSMWANPDTVDEVIGYGRVIKFGDIQYSDDHGQTYNTFPVQPLLDATIAAYSYVLPTKLIASSRFFNVGTDSIMVIMAAAISSETYVVPNHGLAVTNICPVAFTSTNGGNTWTSRVLTDMFAWVLHDFPAIEGNSTGTWDGVVQLCLALMTIVVAGTTQNGDTILVAFTYRSIPTTPLPPLPNGLDTPSTRIWTHVSEDGGASWDAGTYAAYDMSAVLALGNGALAMLSVESDQVCRLCLSNDMGRTWSTNPLPIAYVNAGFPVNGMDGASVIPLGSYAPDPTRETYNGIAYPTSITLISPPSVNAQGVVDLTTVSVAVPLYTDGSWTSPPSKPGYYIFETGDGGATWEQSTMISSYALSPHQLYHANFNRIVSFGN